MTQLFQFDTQSVAQNGFAGLVLWNTVRQRLRRSFRCRAVRGSQDQILTGVLGRSAREDDVLWLLYR